MEDGFKIFPVDIWRLIMYEYLDWKTKQILSSVNKRLRGFFTDFQIRKRNEYRLRRIEKRIHDIDFDRFYIVCIEKFLKIESFIYTNYVRQLQYRFAYLLYAKNEIGEYLKYFVPPHIWIGLEIIIRHTKCTYDEAFYSFINSDGNVMHSILLILDEN